MNGDLLLLPLAFGRLIVICYRIYLTAVEDLKVYIAATLLNKDKWV